MENDLRDIGIGFHIVENGGLAEDARGGREGRTGSGLAALAVDGGHQGCFLTADKGAGAQAQFHIKIEPAPRIFLPSSPTPGLVDGVLALSAMRSAQDVNKAVVERR